MSLARPFWRTGWWRRKGPNCQLPTQSSNLSLTPEPVGSYAARDLQIEDAVSVIFVIASFKVIYFLSLLLLFRAISLIF
jgi:hypothetical protein